MKFDILYNRLVVENITYGQCTECVYNETMRRLESGNEDFSVVEGIFTYDIVSPIGDIETFSIDHFWIEESDGSVFETTPEPIESIKDEAKSYRYEGKIKHAPSDFIRIIRAENPHKEK